MFTLTELAAQLGHALQQKSAQVTTAESCTGVGIAEAITRVIHVREIGSRKLRTQYVAPSSV